jgi:hypothetical protein
MSKKKEVDLRRQSVISDDGHCYDYIHTFGGRAARQTMNSKTHLYTRGGGRGPEYHPTETLKLTTWSVGH